MRRRLFWWEAAGFLFTAVLGAALHFTFAWGGGQQVLAAFSAVNESTWEHMKLLFFPVFLFSVAQLWALGRTYPNFLAVRAAAVLTGLALIPALFYTYTGVLGFHVLWADIAVFLLADLGMFYLEFRLLGTHRCAERWQQLAGLAVLWLLAFLFVYCTFRPPRLGLWRDPVTGLFGVLRSF